MDRGADRSLRIAREINSVEGLKELIKEFDSSCCFMKVLGAGDCDITR